MNYSIVAEHQGYSPAYIKRSATVAVDLNETEANAMAKEMANALDSVGLGVGKPS